MPKNPPVDLYSKDFKRGVALYSNNVMIMEKCEDLLPDCFGFVRGVVDSPDLNLNISRELLQHDRQLKAIEHRIEKKVKAELEKLLKDEREKYEDFFGKFGHGFKYAIYNTFGAQKSLLEDLIEYVYSGNHCRLMLIGDTAQLPPVGQSESPALDERYLAASFSLNIIACELTEVVRQQQLSGILAGATALRDQIASLDEGDEASLPLFDLEGYDDVVRLQGEDLMETLYREYDDFSLEQVVVVCRSNKRANLFNQGVRGSVLFREEEVNAGDYLMVVKNNYYWLDTDSNIGFIANGDIVEVLSVRNVQELYGFRFADATLRFVDYPDEEARDCKLLLSTLYSESPSLTSEEAERLYTTVMEDYADLPNKADRLREMRQNPYYNALQVKFAYALTCHKTQGGQWRTVIVDQGYLGERPVDRDYLRWLYTAFTRATDRVYLLNFDSQFFV